MGAPAVDHVSSSQHPGTEPPRIHLVDRHPVFTFTYIVGFTDTPSEFLS